MARKTLADKINREVKYTNKDFGELRLALINHAKTYFPKTYSDFNESSPGMMFIEMAAAVGDILNFYADVQLQESFMYTVNERLNLYNLSQGLGYKPKTIVPAQVDLDIMQLVPSIGEGSTVRPDFRYALLIDDNIQVQSNLNGIPFRTTQPVNFAYSSSYDPTEVLVYSLDNDGNIEYYLLKKQVKAVQSSIETRTFEFTTAKTYDKIVLDESNVSEIIDIRDSDGDLWYEVPYLAQDLIPISIRNIPYNDPELSQYNSSVPYLLAYRQTEKRFVTRIRKDDKFEIQFGGGLSQEADEEILPNPYNVGMGLDYFNRLEDVSIDPMNFLYTKTYGKAPYNTTLSVRYSVCLGLQGNVKADTITQINSINVLTPAEVLNAETYQIIVDSITINNPEPAYGGLNKKELEVVREEAMANFAAQNRAVTKEDYILRCYTMPNKFGAIAKAYVEQDSQISNWNSTDIVKNPYALNIYVLAYNSSGQFVPANNALKQNLRQYLRQYRLMTDAINIKDPFIINIGIDYEIITKPIYNSYEVILRCNKRLMELFDNKNMEIGGAIQLSTIRVELDKIEGVQAVNDIKFINLYDESQGYSTNVYDVDLAIRNNVLYPSLDPCIFEIKYPTQDIRGRVIDL